MGEFVPLLFDELTPSNNQGGRGALSADLVKLITTVADPGTVHARCSDIVLSRSQPRIFTSNATSPSSWFDGLKDNLLAMSPTARLRLSEDTLAIYKRIVLVPIDLPMIKKDAVDNFQGHQRSAASGAVQDLIRKEIGREATSAASGSAASGSAGVDVD